MSLKKNDVISRVLGDLYLVRCQATNEPGWYSIMWHSPKLFPRL